MKPYGVKHIGPVCKFGCCWMVNPHSGRNRRIGHGAKSFAKRARAAAKKEIRLAGVEVPQ